MQVETFDTSNNEGKLEVMKGWLEGRKVVFTKQGSADWEAVDKPSWYWDSYDYALIKEKEELWVVFTGNGYVFAAAADRNSVLAHATSRGTKPIRYVRVEED